MSERRVLLYHNSLRFSAPAMISLFGTTSAQKWTQVLIISTQRFFEAFHRYSSQPSSGNNLKFNVKSQGSLYSLGSSHLSCCPALLSLSVLTSSPISSLLPPLLTSPSHSAVPCFFGSWHPVFSGSHFDPQLIYQHNFLIKDSSLPMRNYNASS